MEAFSALLAFCAGNSPVTGWLPTPRPVTRSFDVFFHLRLNKRLSKQPRGWWFKTPPWPLWRQCNVHIPLRTTIASSWLLSGAIQWILCLTGVILFHQNTSRLNGASVWIERGCFHRRQQLSPMHSLGGMEIVARNFIMLEVHHVIGKHVGDRHE